MSKNEFPHTNRQLELIQNLQVNISLLESAKCELFSKCSHEMTHSMQIVSCRTNVEMTIGERMSKCSWSKLYASQLGTNSYFLASNLDGGRLEHTNICDDYTGDVYITLSPETASEVPQMGSKIQAAGLHSHLAPNHMVDPSGSVLDPLVHCDWHHRGIGTHQGFY